MAHAPSPGEVRVVYLFPSSETTKKTFSNPDRLHTDKEKETLV